MSVEGGTTEGAVNHSAPTIELLPPRVLVERRPDGATLLRSPVALEAFPRTLGERLAYWAAAAPERVFLGERRGAGWHEVSYGTAMATILALAQGMIDRGLGPARPLAILSDNGVDAALLMLAAMHVGAPVAMVSPAYSLMSQDLVKVRSIAARVAPALVYASDERYRRAIAAIAAPGREALVGAEAVAALATTPGPEVAAMHAATGPDTVAKILFTSGSTGAPKGVINTQRMLCANQQAIAQLWPFLGRRAPRLCDWLPWNHTFGGNHNFDMVVFHGGSLYVDDGRPAPGLCERTVENLRMISPTLYFNVPRGFDVLLPFLEEDAELRGRFFADLDLIFYAAAALPAPLWRRLWAVSERALGRRVFLTSAWGTTETAPLVTSVHYPIDAPGVIGLPAPGAELKLVPAAGKEELRVRAPWVTPGYLGEAELTAAAFDEEGFYKTGDAGALVDPARPELGLRFAGRIAEDFKLTSGTWVHVGPLRVEVIAAAAPLVQDAVITGEGREALGALVFVNPAAARAIAGEGAEAGALGSSSSLREHLAAGLRAHNERCPQSSQRIARALILAEPPAIDAGEITDKGYLNQRAVLGRRAAEVERLYAAEPDAAVIVVD